MIAGVSPGRGALVWLGVAVVFAALDTTDLTDGLLPLVPLILALAAARGLDNAPRALRWVRLLGPVAALASAALGVLVWRLDVGLADLDPATLAAVLLGVSLLTLVGLARRVRAALLPALGLDPDSGVHMVSAAAFVLTLGVAAVDFVRLQDAPASSIALTPADPFVSLAGDLALAFAAIGLFQTRGLRAALARLGLRRLGPRQVAGALVAAALFHAGIGVLELAETVFLPTTHAREERFRLEFVGLPPVVGALLISAAVGVGEEVVFRGALQPRLGVVLTSLIFAATHVQYQLPGVAMIFLLSLALGVLRRRSSTSFTACVHGFYDLGAFLLPNLA
jgi:membrane protease YdiL (CAAX protease family)